MRVRLLYFAVLRDITGKSAEIWNRLRGKHDQLAGYERPPMTAINETYVSPDQPLRDGDEVAFIPPVAGG